MIHGSMTPDLERLPKTRREAAERGERFFFTGKHCASGHWAARATSNGTCVQCQREYNRSYGRAIRGILKDRSSA